MERNCQVIKRLHKPQIVLEFHVHSAMCIYIFIVPSFKIQVSCNILYGLPFISIFLPGSLQKYPSSMLERASFA